MLCAFCQPPQKEQHEQHEQQEQKELDLGRQIHNAPEIPYHVPLAPLWPAARQQNHFAAAEGLLHVAGRKGAFGGLGAPIIDWLIKSFARLTATCRARESDQRQPQLSFQSRDATRPTN